MGKKLRDFNKGLMIGQEIKNTVSRDDMKMVRCIMGYDPHGIPGVIRFLGMSIGINREIRLGMWIELKK